jgi:hypothetical protein
MAHRESTPHAAHDLLLIFGVSAVMLGVVLVGQGLLLAQSTAHLIPSAHAALLPAESTVPTSYERLAADTSPANRVPATPATQTASSDATRVIAAGSPRLDLDHDLRLVLAAMALHKRRTLHVTAHFVPPDKQDVPASVRARAKAVAAHAEAPPPAYRRPNGSGC